MNKDLGSVNLESSESRQTVTVRSKDKQTRETATFQSSPINYSSPGQKRFMAILEKETVSSVESGEASPLRSHKYMEKWIEDL